MEPKPQIIKIKDFKQVPDTSITNEYPTKENGLRAPMLLLAIGSRNTGKSFTTAKILYEAVKDNLYDRYFMISPTYHSNKQYWEFLDMDEDDVFYPSGDSIDKVIQEIEKERDSWEDFMLEKKVYNLFLEQTKNREEIEKIPQFDLDVYVDAGFINDKGEIVDVAEPQWKYPIERPAQCCLVCDDIIGSPALRNSAGITKLAIMNRHLAPLREPFKNRASIGCSCIFLSQTYTGASGSQGIPKSVRLNATHFIFFRNKSKDVMKQILTEWGGVVDEEEFITAYETAVQEKHDNLLVDLHPKCETKRYRKNLNEFIVFPSQDCSCKK